MFKKITYIAAVLSAFVISSISPNFAVSQNMGNGSEDQFKLTAFPNPSSSTITIKYQLPQNTTVKLMIFSVDGSEAKFYLPVTAQPVSIPKRMIFQPLQPDSIFINCKPKLIWLPNQ